MHSLDCTIPATGPNHTSIRPDEGGIAPILTIAGKE
jgi:hypothetical protein